MALASSVFKGAAEALKKVLEPGFVDVPAFSFQFESPADVDLTTPDAVSIFLYSVSPNQFLRNTGPSILSRNPNSVEMRAQDVLLDLYFMITAYAQTKDSEFAILERVIQMLHDYPLIEGVSLTTGLVENENTHVRIEPINLSMDDLNKLWSIFPQKSYRLSMFYQLTPVRMKSSLVSTFKATSSVG